MAGSQNTQVAWGDLGPQVWILGNKALRFAVGFIGQIVTVNRVNQRDARRIWQHFLGFLNPDILVGRCGRCRQNRHFAALWHIVSGQFDDGVADQRCRRWVHGHHAAFGCYARIPRDNSDARSIAFGNGLKEMPNAFTTKAILTFSACAAPAITHFGIAVANAVIGNDGIDARQRAQKQAGSRGKLGIPQNDQVFRLADQLLFGLGQQRATLQQAQRAKAPAAHKHTLGGKMATAIFDKRGQDDVLHSVNRACGQKHCVAAVFQQMFGNRKAVDENLP